MCAADLGVDNDVHMNYDVVLYEVVRQCPRRLSSKRFLLIHSATRFDVFVEPSMLYAVPFETAREVDQCPRKPFPLLDHEWAERPIRSFGICICQQRLKGRHHAARQRERLLGTILEERGQEQGGRSGVGGDGWKPIDAV